MIKKIFVGVLLAGLFGLLVLGAVNRTLAKSGERESISLSKFVSLNQGDGAGNGGETLGRNENQGTRSGDSQENRQGLGTGTGSGNGNGQNSQNNDCDEEMIPGSGGNSGSGQGIKASTSAGDGGVMADAGQWEDPITVTVDSVTEELVIVSNDEGFELDVEGRVLSYMIENGFEIEIGDELVLQGFYEDETFEIGHIKNLGTDLELTIREVSGRPYWAGGNQGSPNH